jgi:hypothetical protein
MILKDFWIGVAVNLFIFIILSLVLLYVIKFNLVLTHDSVSESGSDSCDSLLLVLYFLLLLFHMIKKFNDGRSYLWKVIIFEINNESLLDYFIWLLSILEIIWSSIITMQKNKTIVIVKTNHSSLQHHYY